MRVAGYIQAVLVLLMFSGMLFLSEQVNAQCTNDNLFGATGGTPPCGSENTVNIGAGTYATFTVTNGATYIFNTCGTYVTSGNAFNTQMTGYRESNGALAFFDADNNTATECVGGALQDSYAQWTANFSGTLRVLVDQTNCNACAGGPAGTNCPALGSAILNYQQLNNLTINSSGAAICGGQTRTLNGSPAGGTFSGIGVSGTTFTAPNANQVVTITYTVGQCTTTQNITVNQGPSSFISGSNSFCAGGSVLLTANASAGSGSVSGFQWKRNGSNIGSATNSTYSATQGGTYTVVVTNTNGCSDESAGFVVTVNAVPTVNITGSLGFCTGGSTLLTASATAGSGSITGYQWQLNGGNVGTGSTFNASVAGSYTVIVTNSNGCVTTSAPAVVVQNSNPTVSVGGTNVLCNGAANGTATATPSSGQSPYTYLWDDPGAQTGQTATGLDVGSYIVTVTDANGCTVQSAPVNITQPTVLTMTVNSVNDASCNGVNDGSIGATAAGGVGGYQYSVNGSAFQPNAVFNNLASGFYTVLVQDANGCQATDTATIGNLSFVTLTVDSVTNVSCSGSNDGAFTVSATGSSAPYTFTIDGLNFTNSGTFTGLDGGVYTVLVESSAGCQATTQVTVSEAPQVTVTVNSITNVDCGGASNGAIAITAGGGTAPLTFLWSNASTMEDQTNLTAGLYTVTVTDANGCTATTNATVSQPAPLVVSVASIDSVKCFGGSTGKVDVSVVGGTPPYTYAWSNGPTTEDNINVPAGNYGLTVNDANGCSFTGSYTVGQPTALVISLNSITDVDCAGDGDGAINISVTGGKVPYTYSWSNLSSNQDLSNVAGGNYAVTVTDGNGCTATANYSIFEPAPISITAVVTNVSCNGAGDGAIDATVSGGTSPYLYTWSNAGATEDINGLSSGTYTITVLDIAGCTATASFTVTEPAALGLAVSKTNVSCNGAGDGEVDLTVVGGSLPYTYAWSNAATTQDISGLSGGTYSVTVTDGKGCVDSVSATILEPTAITIIATTNNVSCNGSSDGSITLNVNGGTPSYTYLWSNAATTSVISNLSQGTYTVTVTDVAGCTATDSYNITDPTSLALSIIPFAVSCNGGSDGAADLDVTGGTIPYAYLWSNFASTQDISNVTAGTYTVVVTDGNGCTSTAAAMITQPAALAVSAAATDVTCYGAGDGALDITVTGGTPGYDYLWSNTATTADLTGLGGGNYVIDITDTNGCTLTDSFTVNEPDSIYLTGVITDVTCNGGSDGRIDLTVTGGTGPYTYVWSNTASTQDLTNVAAATYTVNVTDANGCTASATYNVGESPLLATTLAAMNITCYGFNNGSINLTVNGGTAPYTYFWSNFKFTEDIGNLTPGQYTVIVTDDNGCEGTDSITISQPNQLRVSVLTKGAGCGSSANGVIDITVTGGNTPYTFLWSNSETTEDLTNLASGTYIVTVTDANGCVLSDTTVIDADPVPVPTFTATDECQGDATEFTNGSTISAGNMTYIWAFDDGDSSTLENPTHTYAVAGSYDVILTATSGAGCEASLTQTVTVFENPDATIDASSLEVCFGGTATLTVAAGEPSYLWTDSSTSNTLTVDVSGEYGVTVTNTNGCVSKDSVQITVYDSIAATVSADTSVSKGLTVPLTATGGVNYDWQPSESIDFPTAGSVNAGPLETTTYTVTISDANGCSVTRTVTVEVLEDFILDFPNIFTPNGDGDNDVLVIGNAETYEPCEIHIFNRWGNEVFTSKSYNNDWDGTDGGNELSDGTYYYVMSCNGSEQVWKGAITIIR